MPSLKYSALAALHALSITTASTVTFGLSAADERLIALKKIDTLFEDVSQFLDNVEVNEESIAKIERFGQTLNEMGPVFSQMRDTMFEESVDAEEWSVYSSSLKRFSSVMEAFKVKLERSASFMERSSVLDKISTFLDSVEANDELIENIERVSQTTTEYNGNEYMLAKESLTWQDHEEKAKEWGGHLASTHTWYENYKVKSLMSGSECWLGGKRKSDDPSTWNSNDGTSNEWMWIDGTDFTYEYWSWNEPNNWEGEQGAMLMYRSGYWDDDSELTERCAVYKRPVITVYDGYEYMVSTESLTWKDHEIKAREWGGNLASIHSKEENDIVSDVAGYLRCWLGGKRKNDDPTTWNSNDGSSDEWKWIDGTNFTYELWASNEPNNWEGEQGAIHMYSYGYWDDTSEFTEQCGVYKRPEN